MRFFLKLDLDASTNFPPKPSFCECPSILTIAFPNRFWMLCEQIPLSDLNPKTLALEPSAVVPALLQARLSGIQEQTREFDGLLENEFLQVARKGP